MALERIEQHVERGLLLLTPAYWGKPRIGAILAATLRELQTLEDDVWALFEAQHIDTANRARLIVMGKLIGQEPGDFSEEELRTVIKARGLANRSRGTGPDVGAVLVALLGEGEFNWTWIEPAVIYITALSPQTERGVKMAAAVLPFATAAGVQLQFLYTDEATGFEWGENWGTDGWYSTEVM